MANPQIKVNKDQIVKILQDSWANVAITEAMVGIRGSVWIQWFIIAGGKPVVLDVLSYNRPDMDMQEFIKLTSDEMEKVPSVPVVCLTRAGCIIVCSIYPELQSKCPEIDSEMFVVPALASGIKLEACKVLNPELCVEKQKLVPYTKNFQLFDGEVVVRPDLSNIVILLLPFQYFYLVFEDYTLNTDSTVKVVGDHNRKSEMKPEANPFWTTEEIMALGYVVLLMGMKSGATNEDLDSYLTRRLEAFGASIGSKIRSSEIIKAFPEDQLLKLSTELSMYPKFKATMYRGILIGSDEACSHVQGIMKDSNMTLFSLIVQFITSPPTRLHFENVVLKEMITFLEVLKKLEETYADCLGYFKLLNPSSALTANRTFQNLSDAAVSYFASTGDSAQDTLKKLKGRTRISNSYKEKAKQKLKSEYCTSDQTSILTNIDRLRDLCPENMMIDWVQVGEAIRRGERIFEEGIVL